VSGKKSLGWQSFSDKGKNPFLQRGEIKTTGKGCSDPQEMESDRAQLQSPGGPRKRYGRQPIVGDGLGTKGTFTLTSFHDAVQERERGGRKKPAKASKGKGFKKKHQRNNRAGKSILKE